MIYTTHQVSSTLSCLRTRVHTYTSSPRSLSLSCSAYAFSFSPPLYTYTTHTFTRESVQAFSPAIHPFHAIATGLSVDSVPIHIHIHAPKKFPQYHSPPRVYYIVRVRVTKTTSKNQHILSFSDTL